MVKTMPRVIALGEEEWRSEFGWEDELDDDEFIRNTVSSVYRQASTTIGRQKLI